MDVGENDDDDEDASDEDGFVLPNKDSRRKEDGDDDDDCWFDPADEEPSKEDNKDPSGELGIPNRDDPSFGPNNDGDDACCPNEILDSFP